MRLLLFSLLIGLGLTPSAMAAPSGLLCSDLRLRPPADTHKVKNKVIFEEIVNGRFPGALFPLDYLSNQEITPDTPYYDDQGRVLSARAAVAVLENHPASQDLILAWRANTEAVSQSRLEVAGGVSGVLVGDAASGVGQVQSGSENLERLDGGAESAFAQAVCAFNAAQATRRARATAAP